MFKLDFEEEFDQDLEQNLRNIEKYVMFSLNSKNSCWKHFN